MYSHVAQVGMFFLYTVVLFAWVAATIFDDEEAVFRIENAFLCLLFA